MKAAAALLALCLTAGRAFAGNAGEFHASAEIKGKFREGQLYRVHLTDDLLRFCEAGCANLRIFDQKGTEIPYTIIEYRGKAPSRTTYSLEITGYEDIPGGEAITMRLPERHDRINAITIRTRDRDFKKNAVLWGSDDMLSWKLLSRARIWDFSSRVAFRKTDMVLPGSGYRYYRLALSDAKPQGKKEEEAIHLRYRDLEFYANNIRTGKLHIGGIEARSASSKMPAVYDSETVTGFSVRQDVNRTVLDLERPAPFEKISFDIANPYFFRNVGIYFSSAGKKDTYCRIGSGQLFRLPFAGSVETGNAIGQVHAGKGYYRFLIDNGNNPPLEIRAVKIERTRRDLYFIALGNSSLQRISFGDSSLNRPDYDIVHFINQSNWQNHTARELDTGKVMPYPGERPGVSAARRERLERIALISILLLLVGIIGYWLYSLMKNTGSTK